MHLNWNKRFDKNFEGKVFSTSDVILVNQESYHEY